MPKPLGRAWLSDDALELMLTSADQWYPTETGGLLIGYWSTRAEVVITTATLPGPVARHSSYGYAPDAEHDEEEVAREYRRSGRIHAYLGDWHTHPDHAPHPSRKDIRTLARIAAYTDARAITPLMFILGGNPKSWVANLWRFDHQRVVAHTIALWNGKEQEH